MIHSYFAHELLSLATVKEVLNNVEKKMDVIVTYTVHVQRRGLGSETRKGGLTRKFPPSTVPMSTLCTWVEVSKASSEACTSGNTPSQRSWVLIMNE